MKYTAVLRELFDLRSFIAHQPTYARWQLDAQRFVQKHFGEVVPAFEDELRLTGKLMDVGSAAMLITMSDGIKKEEALAARMTEKVSKHAEIWDQRKEDPAFVRDADEITKSLLAREPAREDNHWLDTESLANVAADYCGVQVVKADSLQMALRERGQRPQRSRSIPRMPDGRPFLISQR